MTIGATEEAVFADYLEDRTPQALRRLIEAHQDRIYNLCYQILHHVQDAEDAAQRTMLKVAAGSLSIPSAAGFRSWIYRVAFTTSLDLRAEQVRRRARHQAYALARTDSPVPAVDPELHVDLHRAVASLDDDLRDLLIRHYFERSSLTDLAARENCSRVAIWKKIEKGKNRLREILSSSSGALGARALDARLDSLVPVKAPATLLAKAAPVSPGLSFAPSSGGLLMATKSLGVSKAISAAILLAALGLSGGILLGHRRAQRDMESLEERLRAASADLGGARREIARLGAELARLSSSGEARRPQAEPPGSLKAAVPSALSPAGLSKPGDELKRYFRRLVRAMVLARKAGKDAVTTSDLEMSDPETQQAFAALIPYLMSAQNPCRQADKYIVLIRSALEAMLEESGIELSADQKRGLDDLSEKARTLLDQANDSPASKQGIAKLEAERQVAGGLKNLLTQEQFGQWGSAVGLSMFSSSSSGGDFLVVSAESGPQAIVKGWATKYGLDETEEIAAQPAAKFFAEAISRLDQEFSSAFAGASDSGKSADPQSALSLQLSAYDYRVRSLQAQMEALGQLEGSVTAEHKLRIQNSALAEYVGPVARSVLSPPPNK